MKQQPQYHPLALVFAILAITVIGGLSAHLINAGTPPQGFGASLTLTNDAPNVISVINYSYTPVDNSKTQLYQFFFNVSDQNGYDDLNLTTANVTITFGDETAERTACTNTTQSTTVTQLNCSVAIPYYFNASSEWVINASISDNQGSPVYNASQTMTIASLSAIGLTVANLTWTSNPGDVDDEPDNGPQLVRNQGNLDYTSLNLTAYDLKGVGTEKFFDVGNFTINTTNYAVGTGLDLINGTSLQLGNSSLNHGFYSNRSLYVYADIPAGLDNDTYHQTALWSVSVTS